MNRRTALITGVSSRIGNELAYLFADNSFDLVLVDKDLEQVKKLHEAIKKKYHIIKVYSIVKDLSKATSCAEIYAETCNQGLEINVLVNNAGYGEYGKFVDTDLSKELAVIQTNISSLVHLTKVYLKDMIARNEGKILQLAAIASYEHTPLQAVYAASKAFVLSFTDSLIEELKGTNVTMTALIPGKVNPDLLNKDKLNKEHLKEMHEKKANPRKVADEGFEALMEGEHSAIVDVENELLVGLNNIMSMETVTKIVQETHKK